MREVSVVLGLVLMVTLGAIAVVWATQGGLRNGTTASPPNVGTATPTALATSPTPAVGSPTAPATATASPTVPASPTDQATATVIPTGASPSPSPPPSPSPALSPTAPQREIDFLSVGLDSVSGSEEEPSTERYFTFTVEGPGRIEATVSNVSFGRVTMCIWPGDPLQEPVRDCETLRRGTLTRDIVAAEPQMWNVSLLGAQAGVSPSADLSLRWPTNDARMQLMGFRFQGEAIENYNGFTAEMDTAADGQLAISATFHDDVGAEYPWLLTVEEVGGGPSQTFVDEGTSSSMQSGTAVTGERRYRVTLANRESVSEQRVMLSAELDWP